MMVVAVMVTAFVMVAVVIVVGVLVKCTLCGEGGEVAECTELARARAGSSQKA